MKKYRLIEYDPCFSKEYHTTSKGDFISDLEAFAVMEAEQKKNPTFYYRIEEVEESIMDRVKSYEDACKVLNKVSMWKTSGREYIAVVDGDNTHCFSSNVSQHIIALFKLETITAALNEGWKPDYDEETEPKYFVYYDTIDDECQVDAVSVSFNSSGRLYFKSRELAEYAAKQFAELYKQLLIEKF